MGDGVIDYTLELLREFNETNGTDYVYTLSLLDTHTQLTYFILSLYIQIFIVGLFGNILVLYVVIRHSSMRTITNKFIACLSVSDLLICLFAIPFTPLHVLMMDWVFGEFMCKLVQVTLVTTVFVSTLTSVVIAIDRYMVIVHPHTPRMTSRMQVSIIVAIWLMAGTTAAPAGIFTTLEEKDCGERWPNRQSSRIYTYFILTLQLLLPAFVIAVCYTKVSIQLHKRTKSKLGRRDYHKERIEASRNRKINSMLIAMTVIFIVCWLPLNLFHMSISIRSNNTVIVFLFVHIVAMSSVMYNPFLYGWMNDNFKRHFKELFKPITSRFDCLKKKPKNGESENGRGSPFTQSTLANNHIQPPSTPSSIARRAPSGTPVTEPSRRPLLPKRQNYELNNGDSDREPAIESHM